MTLQGRVLGGRYALGPVLGTGGMAGVYQARDRMLRRTVAVKALHFPYDRDPTFVARFRREARIVAGLSHPNIVAVFDAGLDDDLYYIVMEHVDGQTLSALLDREGPLALGRAAQIARSVCEALVVAHGQGLVHRDVKPGNVMVSRTGEVKVTDFGIARVTAMPSVTGSGPVLGTATYMSPEQAQGRPVDARSDLYSLGCVLYELVAGVPPFVNETAFGLALQHETEEPEPLARHRPDVGAGLEAVVRKALAKQPDDRYQTAQAMGEDLEGVVAGLAPAGARSQRPQRPQPHPAAPAAPGSRSPSTAELPSAAAAPAAAAATAPQRLGRLRWPLVAGLALAVVVLAALLRGGEPPAGERSLQAIPTTVPIAASTAPGSSPAPATSPTTATIAARTSTTTSTTSLVQVTSPTSSRPPEPTQLGLPAALANLTQVLTEGVVEGTVAPAVANDLVHRAQDVVSALQAGNEGGPKEAPRARATHRRVHRQRRDRARRGRPRPHGGV